MSIKQMPYSGRHFFRPRNPVDNIRSGRGQNGPLYVVKRPKSLIGCHFGSPAISHFFFVCQVVNPSGIGDYFNLVTRRCAFTVIDRELREMRPELSESRH